MIATSGDDGVTVASYTYGPYGQVDDLTGNPYRFVGRRIDIETGFYYNRARYYSPQLGRFLSADPIGYGDGLNMYTYAANDPVNRRDPSGLKSHLGLEDILVPGKKIDPPEMDLDNLGFENVGNVEGFTDAWKTSQFGKAYSNLGKQENDKDKKNEDNCVQSPADSNDEAENLKNAEAAFRNLVDSGLVQVPFKNNFVGGLDNKAFSFTFVNELRDGRVAEQSSAFTGAKVFRGGATTFYEALDTVAHEIKHLDPFNVKLWLSDNMDDIKESQTQAVNFANETLDIFLENLCRE